MPVVPLLQAENLPRKYPRICVKTYEPLNEIYETRRGDDCPLAIQEVDT